MIFIIERFSKPMSEAHNQKISSFVMPFNYINNRFKNSSLFRLKENSKKNIVNIFLDAFIKIVRTFYLLKMLYK